MHYIQSGIENMIGFYRIGCLGYMKAKEPGVPQFIVVKDDRSAFKKSHLW